jgi:quercetin dioxygenase-like cupin family protein
MYFDGTYRFIGKIDPQPLVSEIESWREDAWVEFARRQETYEVHRRTQTIPLIFDEDMRHTGATQWPRWKQLEPVVEPVLETIRAANRSASANGEDGYFIRIILTRLSPHGWIPRHRDHGESLICSHRNHVPLVTQQGVEFEVAEEVRHLPAGEIWEINNRQLHAVRNVSDSARIHLIADYVVPGERVEDPEGAYTA